MSEWLRGFFAQVDVRNAGPNALGAWVRTSAEGDYQLNCFF